MPDPMPMKPEDRPAYDQSVPKNTDDGGDDIHVQIIVKTNGKVTYERSGKGTPAIVSAIEALPK